MTDTMLAVSQNEFGGPEVLHLVSLPIPTPGVGEVLIRWPARPTVQPQRRLRARARRRRPRSGPA